VNKYVDIEKRLALSEYKRNKDKKKINRITNDLYEEYEVKSQIPQIQTIDKTQTQPQQIMIDEDFESELKRIIENDKVIEDDYQQNDNQPQQYEPSFKLILKRRK
jgi:hypothetical protein